jgi:5'-deoxynucleotidase YfbR-like HD superfamily hydrolase
MTAQVTDMINRKNYEGLSLKLHKRLRGGYVMRYHTTPEVGAGQNVGEHTWRACVIMHTLWPDISRDALLHMMYHDVAEAELGDLPAPTKWKYKELAKEYSKAEKEYETLLGVHSKLNEQDAQRCKMADMLELILHCARQLILGNNYALHVYKNGLRYIYDTFRENPDFKVVARIIDDIQDAIDGQDTLQRAL